MREEKKNEFNPLHPDYVYIVTALDEEIDDGVMIDSNRYERFLKELGAKDRNIYDLIREQADAVAILKKQNKELREERKELRAKLEKSPFWVRWFPK